MVVFRGAELRARALILLAYWFAIFGSGQLCAGENLLRDADFAQARQDLTKSPWALYLPGPDKPDPAKILTIDAQEVTLHQSGNDIFFLTQRDLPLQEGRWYTFRFEAKGENACNYSLYLEWISDTNTFFDAPLGKERNRTAGTEWQVCEFTFLYQAQKGQTIRVPPYFAVKLNTPGVVTLRNVQLLEAAKKTQAGIDDNAGEEMAGALQQSESKAPAELGSVTLRGVDQLPPTRLLWQTCQLGNTHPPADLVFRHSEQITAGGITGAQLGGGLQFLRPGGFLDWSVRWLVEPLSDDGRRIQQDCYSSQLYRSADTPSEVAVELEQPREITRICLWPRNQGLVGFPHALQIYCRDKDAAWVKVVDETGDRPAAPSGAMEYSFPAVRAKFVKVVATHLRAENKVYYFQLRRIGIYDAAGENWALRSHGAEATSPEPLSSSFTDSETAMAGIRAVGLKWVICDQSAGESMKRLQEGKPAVDEQYAHNLETLNRMGIQVVFRISGFYDKLLDASPQNQAWCRRMIESIVTQLKGKVAIWAILNEENMYNMYRYKAAIAGTPGATTEDWINGYVRIVSTASDCIRSLDPGTKIAIETALFDFGWTQEILKRGLRDKIDCLDVHVYKESMTPEIYPEMTSTFIRDGRRHNRNEQPYATYLEELAAYRKLLDSLNPRISINVTETAVNILPGDTSTTCMAVSELAQAKYLSRMYLLHYWKGVGPTCWWGYAYSHFSGTEWGLLDRSGRYRDAWHALRNVSAVLDLSYRPAAELQVALGTECKDTLAFTLKNPEGTVLVPFWAVVPMRDSNTGAAADVRIEGMAARKAEAIDMLSGKVQTLEFSTQENVTVISRMVLRDYPVVIRLEASLPPVGSEK